jgi:hypothetical protein
MVLAGMYCTNGPCVQSPGHPVGMTDTSFSIPRDLMSAFIICSTSSDPADAQPVPEQTQILCLKASFFSFAFDASIRNSCLFMFDSVSRLFR